MHFQTIITSTLLLISSAAAAATPTVFSRQNASAAAAVIQSIMPTSKTCDGAKFPMECRTAAQAAPLFIAAMRRYGLTAPAQIAAILALVGVESGDLKYKHNVFPGRAGQGTSAMLMFNFIEPYAESFPELHDRVAAAGGDPNTILALVEDDQYNFGSAQWFLTTQCPGVADQLRANADAGFLAHMKCVGVTVDEQRQTYWDRAKAAFGL